MEELRDPLANTLEKAICISMWVSVVFSARPACSSQGDILGTDESVTLQLENWEARINAQTLTVDAKLRGRERGIAIAESSGKTFSMRNLSRTRDAVRWTIPELEINVEFRAIKNHLHAHFETTREQKFTWPISGHDPALSALIYPDGEGLYVPLNDAFWMKRLTVEPCRDTHGGLSMPFWSYQLEGGTMTYLALSDMQSTVCVSSQESRISTYAVYEFRKRDGPESYNIEIWPGAASGIAPGIEYRQWLIENGEYVSLDQKSKQNPEVGKL